LGALQKWAIGFASIGLTLLPKTDDQTPDQSEPRDRLDRRQIFAVATGATLGGSLATDSAAAQSESKSVVLDPSPGAADHIPLIQEAIDRLELQGGGRIDLGSGRYSCLSGPLRIDPTRTTLTGVGATLDFSRRQIGTSDPRCVLVIPKASSPQYGHAPYRLQGIKLIGSRRADGSVGIAFRADKPGLSSRLAVYNLDIAGFDTGILLEQGCYLTQFYSSSVRDCMTCVRMPPKQRDAGENISFFGCTLMNSHLAMDNAGGANLIFVASSINYVDLWYDGSGLVNFFGCWFEKQKPTSATPLFRVRGGSLLFQGGLMQVSGVNFESEPSNAAVFQIDSKYSRVVLDGISLWNVRSSAHALATGPGRLISRDVIGGSNKQVNGIPNASPRQDLFGGQGAFAGPRLGVEAVLSSDDPSDGPPHRARYGTLRLAPNDAGGGVRSALEILKGGGKGNPLTLSFYCPILPVRIPTVRFKWSVLRNGEPTPARVWAVMSAVQKIGYEPSGRPIIGANERLAMATLEAVVGPDPTAWADVFVDTMMTDEHSESDGFTSDWVTHLCLTLNMVDLPTDCTMRIASLEAYAV
jgi:hypothetical protein